MGPEMKLVVAGGTGFIGTALLNSLAQQGHALVVLTRRASPAGLPAGTTPIVWQPGSPGTWENVLPEALSGADGVINLAGEPIAGKRWTGAQKQKLRASRVDPTRALVDAIGRSRSKPGFLLNASAVGYYGPRGDETVTEADGPGGDFLARLCREWEDEAKKAEAHGLRVVRLRTGVVLGRDGGALAKMIPPFKLFFGGPLGSGAQWLPWIHLEDEVGLIRFLLENPAARGPVNATAPNPVTMKEFAKALGGALHRPSWAPVPAFALRLMLGEMAEMLLTGQRALPAEAERLGYRFRHPALPEALRDILA
ncbi:MAG TPA: TIGR01777 family oxidoreductase [Candidatus Binatia bacterium]